MQGTPDLSDYPDRVCTSTRVHVQVYAEPTVLLAKRVTGEEQVPDGCVVPKP